MSETKVAGCASTEKFLAVAVGSRAVPARGLHPRAVTTAKCSSVVSWKWWHYRRFCQDRRIVRLIANKRWIVVVVADGAQCPDDPLLALRRRLRTQCSSGLRKAFAQQLRPRCR